MNSEYLLLSNDCTHGTHPLCNLTVVPLNWLDDEFQQWIFIYFGEYISFNFAKRLQDFMVN